VPDATDEGRRFESLSAHQCGEATMPYRIYVTRREGKGEGFADEKGTGTLPEKGEKLEVHFSEEKIKVIVTRITRNGGIVVHVDER
jgi:hypothetical protein